MRYFSGQLNTLLNLGFVLTVILGCSHTLEAPAPASKTTNSVQTPPAPSQEGFSKICFLMIEVQTGQVFNSFNEEICSEQFPAAYTFNLPLYLMALEEKLPAPKKTNIHQLLRNNHSENPKLGQHLVNKLSFEKLRNYLRNFEYGNQDLSSGYEKVATPAESHLKISGFEQTSFLRNLTRGRLHLKNSNGQLALSKLPTLKDKKGNLLNGKTSYTLIAGSEHEEPKTDLSWYIGYLNQASKQYVITTVVFKDISQTDLESKKSPSKNEALNFTLQRLQEIGSWSPR